MAKWIDVYMSMNEIDQKFNKITDHAYLFVLSTGIIQRRYRNVHILHASSSTLICDMSTVRYAITNEMAIPCVCVCMCVR
jgi:hypothetical protein